MKRAASVLICLLTFSNLTIAIKGQDRPNVLLICIDDLRPELACFGVDYIESPNIDALAANGRAFHRHYVQAPTCGASRFALLTGCYGPYGNGALFQRGRAVTNDADAFPPSFPAWFRQHGYATVSVGKISHHPGGRGGPNWDDDSQSEMPLSWDRHLMPVGAWQHPRGSMHGLAHGEIRRNAKDMDVYQAVAGDDSIYPDGLTTEEALSQLEQLVDVDREQPFFLAVGIIRPHLPFGAPEKYLEPYANVVLPETPYPSRPQGRTTWHGSGEFMKYNRWERNPNDDAEFAELVRKHYAACVSYADAQVGRLIEKLDLLGVREDTIIVVWGDHGWHLGEHSVWGKHTLFEESLRSPLIITYGDMTHAGEASDAIVETIDIYPTICELAGLPLPDEIDGESLAPMIDDPANDGDSAISYMNQQSIRTDRFRLIRHADGYVELYDHESRELETANVAEANPDVVERLTEQLDRRLDR